MNLGIRTRLMLTYILLIFISMSILGLALLWPLKDYYVKNSEKDLVEQARLISSIIEPYLIEKNYPPIASITRDLGERVNTRITIIRKDGKVLGDSNYNFNKMENHAGRPEIKKALEGSKGVATRYSTTLDIDTMYVALPLEYQGEVIAIIRVSLPLIEINKTLFNLEMIILTGIILASSIAVLLSIKLSRTITEPIKSINNTAKKIAQGDLEQKIFTRSKDELGQLSHAINDMTLALKKQIQEVTAGKKRIEAILNHMVSGVLVISNRGIIQSINPEAIRMFGTSIKKAINKPYQSVIRNFGLQEMIEKVINTGEVESYEFSTIYPENLTLKAYIAPVNHEGENKQIVIVFHDITMLRQLEKMKTDFVANASHELRTPVAAIKGFAETLLDGALENETLSKRFIAIIDKEADRLIRLINDLLDLSRIEAKGAQLSAEPIDIGKLLHSSVVNLSNEAAEKEVKLEINVANDLPPVRANKDMITQAFVNLIDNAIKYTNSGGKVEVGAVVDEGYLKIKFKDSGIGIPKEDVPRIFERFYRVDKARSKEVGGTGLGLSIVKHIMELHKGYVHVQSELGKGTTFWLALPIAAKE